MELLTINDAMMDEIVDTSWRVYKNPLTRFYPIVDNKADIQRNLQRAYQNNTLLVLVDKENDKAILPLLVDAEAQYIQAVGGIVSENKVELFSRAFNKILSQQFKRYTFFVGYPSSNASAIRALEKEGFLLVESLLRYEATLNGNAAQYEALNVHELNQNDTLEFCTFHNAHNPDVFWTGEKILENRDRWTIRVFKEAEIIGAVCAMHYTKDDVKHAEIYFMNGQGVTEHLIVDLMKDLENKGVQKLVYLVEDAALDKIAVLEKYGFQCIDDYRGYSKRF